MSRQRLPITQRHRKDCTRRRDCDCGWTGRVRLPDGTMPRFGGDTWAEAERAYYELKARKPEPLADRTTTIEQWAQRWLASGPARNWRQETRAGRRYTVPKYILPELGHIPVTELRRDDVRAWAARMRDRGTGPSAIRQALAVLAAMYGAWLDDGRPLPHGTPIPRGMTKAPPRKEFTPPTPAQVAAWAAAIGPHMSLLVEIEAFYGARSGEIRALREEDITFTGQDVAAPLAPQLARLAALPADKYEARSPQLRFARKIERDRAAGPIKNQRGNRTLPLPQWLAAAFAAQLEQWPPVDGWLFTNRRGPGGNGRWAKVAEPRPYTSQTYLRLLKQAAADAGLTLPPNQCSHALRHFCVSVLRDKGWSDQDIGYWIGDTAQTVATVYGRPMPGAMDRIAAALSGTRGAAPGLRAVT